MENTSFFGENNQDYKNSLVTAMKITDNFNGRSQFKLFNQLARKFLKYHRKLNKNYTFCCITNKKLEVFKDYPLVDGIIIISMTKPNNHFYIPLLNKNKMYYVSPISYSALTFYYPDFENKVIVGRLYPSKSLSKLLYQFNLNKIKNKNTNGIKIKKFIHKWYKEKKSIEDSLLLECETQQETSRCSIC
tara:strand:- start:48 stop:614 length:567 start_codon:yes stop_codon:yes gene_type:complete